MFWICIDPRTPTQKALGNIADTAANPSTGWPLNSTVTPCDTKRLPPVNYGFSLVFGMLPLKYIFHYINIPHKLFIQIDMILNYMFRLGLRGNVLIEASKIPRALGALCIYHASISTFPRSPRRNI